MKRSMTLLGLAIVVMLASCDSKTYTYPTVKVQTLFGSIIMELYPEKAPLSVAAFLKNVESGAYKNSNFYRVMKAEDLPSSVEKTELIQGGIHYSNPTLVKELGKIALETTEQTGLHHEAGSVSLARSTEESSASEFFISLNKSPAFDFGGSSHTDKQGYAVFGKVIEGMDVVRKIHAQSSNGAAFTPKITIREITVLGKK